MKKLFFIMFILISHGTKSCNLCLGYTGRMLRQQAIDKVDCDCNCAQQYHIRWDDKKGYGCIRCGHRLMPINPVKQENIQIKSNPKTIKKFQKYSYKQPRPVYKKQKHQIPGIQGTK